MNNLFYITGVLVFVFGCLYGLVVVVKFITDLIEAVSGYKGMRSKLFDVSRTSDHNMDDLAILKHSLETNFSCTNGEVRCLKDWIKSIDAKVIKLEKRKK